MIMHKKTVAPEYKALLDRAPVLMAYMDRDFNFVWVNSAFATADHREPAFFVGKNHFSLYPNDENEEIFRRVLRTGQLESYESKPFVYADRPDSGTTWWDWTLVPIRGSDGIEGLLLTLSNATRRHLAEEAIRAERANLERTVKARTRELRATVRRLQGEMAARRILEQQRVERIMREEVLSHVTAALATVIPDELEAALHNAVRQLGELVDVDQVRLTRLSSPFSFSRCVIQWPAGGAPADDGHNERDDFPWMVGQLLDGRTVRFSRLQEVPADVPDLRQFSELGIKAFAALPLRMGSQTIGALSLSCVYHEREWSDELMGELETLCWTLGGALFRWEAAISLREKEMQMRDLLETMAAIPLIYDPPARRFVYVGPQVTPLLGYRPQEWCQPGFWEQHVLEEDLAPTMERLEAAARSGASAEVEYRMRARDGRIAWVCHRFRAHRVAPDTMRMWGILFDITERRNDQEQARQLRNEISHMSRVGIVGEFAASLAHELNQPLAAILGNAQAAQRFLDSPNPDLEEVRSAIEDIVSDNRRASETIRRLRDLLRKGQVERKPLDVNQVIQEVLVLVREELIAKSVHLDFEAGADLPVAMGDRVQLQQVLLNLILNACEAMVVCPRSQRKLTIHTYDQAGRIVVAVTDQAPPIPEEHFRNLFTPFFTTKPMGLGMGLSISKAVIEAHGGDLRAVRNPGRGLTMLFELPCGHG